MGGVIKVISDVGKGFTNLVDEGFEELIQETKLPVYDSTLKKMPLETLKL